MSPFQPVNPMRRPATATQRKAFDFIARHCQRERPPTMREIAQHMGYTSTNAIADVLEALAKKGWIEIETFAPFGRRRHRSIHVRGAEVSP